MADRIAHADDDKAASSVTIALPVMQCNALTPGTDGGNSDKVSVSENHSCVAKPWRLLIDFELQKCAKS